MNTDMRSFATAFPIEAGDTAVSYLPSAHAADRFITHYFAISYGVTVTSIADPKQLPLALAEVRPTNRSALSRISGIGPAKLDKYGDEVLEILA